MAQGRGVRRRVRRAISSSALPPTARRRMDPPGDAPAVLLSGLFLWAVRHRVRGASPPPGDPSATLWTHSVPSCESLREAANSRGSWQQ